MLMAVWKSMACNLKCRVRKISTTQSTRLNTQKALHEVLYFGGCLAREEVFQARGFGGQVRRKNLGQRLVHVLDRAVGADRDDASRNALQDGFGEAPPPVQFDAARFQRFGHL